MYASLQTSTFHYVYVDSIVPQISSTKLKMLTFTTSWFLPAHHSVLLAVVSIQVNSTMTLKSNFIWESFSIKFPVGKCVGHFLA